MILYQTFNDINGSVGGAVVNYEYIKIFYPQGQFYDLLDVFNLVIGGDDD